MLNIRKLLVLLCCINSNILNAQNIKDVTLRPVIGINMSSIKGDFIGIGNNSLNSHFKIGYSLGFEIQKKMSNVFYGIVGLHYSLNGSKYSDYSNSSENMKWEVYDFYTNLHSESSGKAVTNVSFLYNKIDFGIPFRLSYEYKKGVFTLGYYMGLANIYKNSSNRIYNNSFSLSYGYNF